MSVSTQSLRTKFRGSEGSVIRVEELQEAQFFSA